jgi:hypothetical protein
VTRSGWIENRSRGQVGQWISHPNAPTERIASRSAPKTKLSIKTEGLPNPQNLSVSAKLCDSFSMVLRRHRRSVRNIGGASNRVEGYINERLRRAERHGNSTWRLGNSSASRHLKRLTSRAGLECSSAAGISGQKLLSWPIILNYLPLDRIQWGCVRADPRRIHTDEEVHIRSEAFATVRIWARS